MHLHSVVWWVAAALAVRALYMRTYSARVANIGAIVFALSPAHAMPIAWLANRETLVSLTFGALALASYSAFRENVRVRDGTKAFLFFALALFGGGEYALSLGGYVLAIELVRARGREALTRRALGFATFGVPALAYVVTRAKLHYGTLGSGYYSDPTNAPARFLAKVPARIAALLGDGWLTVETAWGAEWQTWAVAIAVIAFGAIAALAARHMRAEVDANVRRDSAWLGAGSVISLVPMLAVVPNMRLMGAPMIGIAAIVALVVDRAWFPDERPIAPEVVRFCAIVLGFAHLVHAPVTTWLVSRQIEGDAANFQARAEWLRERLARADASTPEDVRVGVVRGLAGVFFVPFATGTLPAHWYVLAHTGHELVVRESERTLLVRVPDDHSLFPKGEANLYLDEDDAKFHLGEQFEVPGMRVTILAVGPAGPRQARIELDRDADSLVWIRDDNDTLNDAELPRQGFGAPFDP
jgi:hypothetical protein